MYLYVACSMTLLTAAYGRIVNRIRSDRLMLFLQLVGVLLFLTLWYFGYERHEHSSSVAQIIFCSVEVYVLLLTMHYWSYVNSLYSSKQGRKVIPLLGSFGAVGIICAGVIAQCISQGFGSYYLLPVWVVLLGASLAMTMQVAKKRACALSSMASESDAPSSTLTKTLRVIWGEPLIRTLTFMALPMWVLIYIIDYCYFDALNRTFANRDELASFLGMCLWIFALVGLIVQVTVTPRLLRIVGVGATSMIFPLTLGIGAMCLLLYSILPGSSAPTLEVGPLLLLILVARFCDVGIYFSVYDSSSQLLYYSVPTERQAQSRAFISGFIFPVSMASAGMLILLFRDWGEPLYNVAFVGFAMGFLLVAFALNITPDYLRALLTHSVREGDTDCKNALDEMRIIDPSDSYYVLLQALTSSHPAEAEFARQQILQLDVRDRYLDFIEIADQIEPHALRKMLKGLEQHSDPDARRFLEICELKNRR